MGHVLGARTWTVRGVGASESLGVSGAMVVQIRGGVGARVVDSAVEGFRSRHQIFEVRSGTQGHFT
jgi:hypothetical protein